MEMRQTSLYVRTLHDSLRQYIASSNIMICNMLHTYMLLSIE